MPLLAVAVFAVGCVHASGPAPAPSAPAPREPAPEAPQPDPNRDPLLGVGGPFSGRRVADGSEMTGAELLDELAGADLVCAGERHDEVVDHWAELAILYGLLERAELSGHSVGLGLEMWEARSQAPLDEFAAGKLEEPALLEQTEWAARWGFDFAYYRPTVELARQRGGGLLGLNAPRELVREVARHGLRRLPEADRSTLPELDLDDEVHRAAFDSAIAEHPEAHRLRHLYAAQVVRDESMATTAAAWLAQRQPAGQLLVLAGVEHCRNTAVPARVERRLVGARVTSVRSFRAPPPTEPEELAGYDFLLVLDASD
jgi:uncharacterized iron-regulated protein